MRRWAVVALVLGAVGCLERAETAGGPSPEPPPTVVEPPVDRFLSLPAYPGAYPLCSMIVTGDLACEWLDTYGVPADVETVRAFLVAQRGVVEVREDDTLTVLRVAPDPRRNWIMIAPSDVPLQRCEREVRDPSHTRVMTRAR